MSKPSLCDLTATEASQRIRAGELTSVAYVESCLERTNAREPEVEAWVHLDSEQALSQARASDARRKSGAGSGPLDGIPVGIKDIIATVDMPTQNGCAIFKGHQTDHDAGCVAQLRSGGAVIMGKTVTTELATLTPNKTRNPHNPAHTPGGSSSGSAAAVAAGMVPLALGTQTGGSVIRPGSFCGVYAIKPTLGLISRTGVTMQSHLLDTVGVYGRSLADLALGLDGLSAHDAADPISYPRPRSAYAETLAAAPLPKVRLGFFKSPAWEQAEPAAKDAIERLAKSLGEHVATLDIPAFEGIVRHHHIVMGSENASYYGPLLAASPDGISPGLAERIRAGQRMLAGDYVDALRAREQIYAAFERALDGFSAVLTLSSPGPAPKGLQATGNPIFNGMWTYLGVPCVSLPLMTIGGMPCGAQLVGLRRDEARLLRVARWLDENAKRVAA